MNRSRKTRVATRFLMAVGVLTAAGGAFADRLILHDGGELHGNVERTRAGYVLTTSNGQTTVFAHDDVKRAAYVARVTPAEAAEMMAELREIMAPAIQAPEPEQFVFINDIVAFDESESFKSSGRQFRADRSATRRTPHRARSASRSFTRGASRADRELSGSIVTTVERDKTADNVFADEWLRYIAPFEASAHDTRYLALADARVHADSLGDFSRRAPEEYDQAATAVRVALAAVDNCLDLAADTRARIQALPLRALDHDEDIRELQNDLEREKDKVRTARNYWRQKRRVFDAEDRLREAIAKKETELARARRVAERKINDFARARELADQLLQSAQAELDALAQSQP